MTSEGHYVEVKLLGELGRRFGRYYKFFVESPRDVISALARQLDGFREYLATAHENGIGFRLVTTSADGIDYQELNMACERMVLAPIVTGAGAVGRILLGVALIALSFVSFGTGAWAGVLGSFQTGAFAATGSMMAFSLGGALLFSGISAILAPPVTTIDTGTGSSSQKRKDSFMFDRAAELTTQGFPMPIVYGTFLVNAPAVISSSISTQNIAI